MRTRATDAEAVQTRVEYYDGEIGETYHTRNMKPL